MFVAVLMMIERKLLWPPKKPRKFLLAKLLKLKMASFLETTRIRGLNGQEDKVYLFFFLISRITLSRRTNSFFWRENSNSSIATFFGKEINYGAKIQIEFFRLIFNLEKKIFRRKN